MAHWIAQHQFARSANGASCKRSNRLARQTPHPARADAREKQHDRSKPRPPGNQGRPVQRGNAARRSGRRPCRSRVKPKGFDGPGLPARYTAWEPMGHGRNGKRAARVAADFGTRPQGKAAGLSAIFFAQHTDWHAVGPRLFASFATKTLPSGRSAPRASRQKTRSLRRLR